MRVLTLDEAIERIASGAPWREPAALVTFDDGYRDNFEAAAPILRERGIPATFFLPTAFLESPRLPWWDHVACIIKQTRVNRLELPRRPAGKGNGSGTRRRSRSTWTRCRDPRRSTRSSPPSSTRRSTDGPWFLEKLADRAEVALDADAMARALFTDWDQVRRLTGPETGLSVGSHGHSHQKLAGLDADSQRRELVESKRILDGPARPRDRCAGLSLRLAGHLHRGDQGPRRRVPATAWPSPRSRGSTARARSTPSTIRRLGVGSGDSAVLLRGRVGAACHPRPVVPVSDLGGIALHHSGGARAP